MRIAAGLLCIVRIVCMASKQHATSGKMPVLSCMKGHALTCPAFIIPHHQADCCHIHSAGGCPAGARPPHLPPPAGARVDDGVWWRRQDLAVAQRAALPVCAHLRCHGLERAALPARAVCSSGLACARPGELLLVSEELVVLLLSTCAAV